MSSILKLKVSSNFVKTIQWNLIVYLKLSFGVGYLLFDDALFRLGVFVMGCCPGGNASNFWCKLLGGDLNLSVTMTTISTVSALGE